PRGSNEAQHATHVPRSPRPRLRAPRGKAMSPRGDDIGAGAMEVCKNVRSQWRSDRMNDATAASRPRVRKRVSAEEWAVREDLAACYRLAAHFRMTDLIYTHISARVPGPEHHFLINAFGQMW